jgi:hypothetical protein
LGDGLTAVTTTETLAQQFAGIHRGLNDVGLLADIRDFSGVILAETLYIISRLLLLSSRDPN